MSPKTSDVNREHVSTLQFHARLVRHGLIFLSVLIAFNLLFFFRAMYYFHNPTDLVPYSPKYILSSNMVPEISSSGESALATTAVQVLEPASKDVSVRSASSAALSVVNERATPGWTTIAIAGLWSANQALAWYGIVSSCRDFSGAGAQFSCVAGAMTTCLAYGGTVYKAYQWTGHLVDIYNQNGWKRDEDLSLDSLSEFFNSTVWYAGAYTPPALPVGSMLSEATATGPRHVFGFTSPFGGDMHFTYMGNHSVTGQHMWRFGFGKGLANTTSKREGYHEQYFTSGGIDYIQQWAGDSEGLDPAQDYIHLYEQILCQMTGRNSGEQTAEGSWFQIYDNIHDETITGGSIAPFRAGDHWSAISVMWDVPAPVKQQPGCSNVE